MFQPPFCPYRACARHTDPGSDFYIHFGTYPAACRSHPVPRYRCRTCQRTFSRQTFRFDRHDHRPDLGARLFTLLSSGLGLRQSARNLGCARSTVVRKFRKLGRHLRRFNLALRSALPRDVLRLHFDEFETYEEQRNTRPLTVPMLIATESRYIIWAESAPIRPRGPKTEKRKKALKRAEERHGVRHDLSQRAIQRTLARGEFLVSRCERVVLDTDEKTIYPQLARRAFGGRLEHRQTSSRLVRDTFNPLFPINHEEALARDLMGRLRRESWLVSKRRRFLDLALQVHMAFRNLVRRRFNHDEESPAQLLGFVPRRLRPEELLTWRLEWGKRGPHPLSPRGVPVERWRATGRAGAAAA